MLKQKETPDKGENKPEIHIGRQKWQIPTARGHIPTTAKRKGRANLI